MTTLEQSPMYAYLPAKDLERARAFYEKKLGFEPQGSKGGGVFYRFGGGTAAFLYPTPNAGTSLASQAFWKVADTAATVADLEKRGVVFEEYGGEKIHVAGGAKAAWFKDSEGNILALIEDVE